MVTLLLFDGDRATEVDAEPVTPVAGTDAVDFRLDAAAVLAATGWEVKPYGLCRGDVCNPAQLGDTVTLRELAAALHRPVATEPAGDGTDSAHPAVAVLGEPGGSTAGVGDLAPELTLPDVNGDPVAIAGGGTGRKTAVVTWSTWCGCRYELPSWQKLAEELGPLGLDLVTVALDEDVEAVRKWTSRTDPDHLPTAVDADHRVSDVFGIVNVPATVWLDEEGRVVKPPTIAPGDDKFKEFTEVDAEEHHRALREWVTGGAVPEPPSVDDGDDVRAARAERRLAAWLHRQGRTVAAEQHFARATELAPLDFSIVRSSMTSRGQDPFGTDFFALWEEWDAAGRPGYTPTVAPAEPTA